ncbi:amidohydrolase family protein [Bradyrhizobium iriomotense]|uniref:Hydrolase n=1 Tax=Bradyrhizobium iriomotense TaxID=441950 RepID=A0ABQ6B2W9_9BRAD|nr:amidohydrolase family protein [Bradyrhizobium iriomotense]GLR88752.1 hydrolase [Bradyrhizobium iriomotense]
MDHAGQLTRRSVLGSAAATFTFSMVGGAAGAADGSIPYSAGNEGPRLRAPAHACDCHFHIYNSQFPAAPNASITPPDALVQDYLRLRSRLGVSRGVIVTPSTYGTDNSCTLDAMAQLGDSVRGVAVVDTSVSDAELSRLHERGIRGIRFNIARAGATTVEMIEPLAARIAAFGWHVQIHMSADAIIANGAIFERLPVSVVFDHLGRIPQPQGKNHPAFALISRLLAEGKAWVKLSGAYQDTRVGPPDYADVAEVARAYIKQAPDRLLWGSDWPHPSKGNFGLPNDALLFDLVAGWAGPEAWTRILVSNPEALYGFAKAA